MGALIVLVVAGLAIFGASNAAKQDAIKEDTALFDSQVPSFNTDQKKDAIRVYFVELGEYKRIEDIPNMSDDEINTLFLTANLYFKDR